MFIIIYKIYLHIKEKGKKETVNYLILSLFIFKNNNLQSIILIFYFYFY